MQLTSLAAAVERAAEHGGGRGFRFVKNDKWSETFCTFSDIERQTLRIGGALQELGLHKGERVAIILPDTQPFVVTFLGALRAGIVPVPIYPPSGLGQLAGYLDTTRHIVAKSGARALVTSASIKPLLGTVKTSSGKLQRTKTLQLYNDGLLTGRASAREADRVEQVKEVARSQFEYLKLAVLGRRRAPVSKAPDEPGAAG